MDRRGQSIVEVIVAIAILAIGASSIIMLVLSSFRGGLSGGRQTEAVSYGREGWEATRSIGTSAYNHLVNGTYGLTDASGAWAFSGSSDTNADYTRAVAVADVNRDGSGAIVASGGSKDIQTKQVTTTVSWLSGTVARTLTYVDYITNWDSRQFFHDLSAHFNTGTQASTQVYTDADSDGAEGLATTPPIAWYCAEVEGGIDDTGNAAAVDVVVNGNFAYYVTNVDSAGPEFLVVNVSDPASPATVGSLELGASATSVSISGQFVYVTTDSNSAELMVVNVTTPTAPTLAGTLNLAGNVDALDIYATGSRAYLTRSVVASGPEFFILNISAPTTPFTISSLDLGATSRGVHLSGGFALVVTDDAAAEFRVIDLAVEATPSVVRSVNLAGSAAGMELDVNGSYAYVVTANDAATSEFYAINISVPASAAVSGSTDLGNGANAIEMDGTFAMIATGTAGRTLQTVDASTPTAPTLSASLSISDFGYNGVYWNGSRLFVAT
ncbi:MAG: prepilin-type N-terminal cleavage/methylation domain-containing protein, partial [Patescibacteria group bacterium]